MNLYFQKIIRQTLCFISFHSWVSETKYAIIVHKCKYCGGKRFISEYGFWTNVKNEEYFKRFID